MLVIIDSTRRCPSHTSHPHQQCSAMSPSPTNAHQHPFHAWHHYQQGSATSPPPTNILPTCLATVQWHLPHPWQSSNFIPHTTPLPIGLGNVSPSHQCPPQPSTPFSHALPLLSDVFLVHQHSLWPSTLFLYVPPRLGDVFSAHEFSLQPSNFILCISPFISARLTLSPVRTRVIINTVSVTPPPSHPPQPPIAHSLQLPLSCTVQVWHDSLLHPWFSLYQLCSNDPWIFRTDRASTHSIGLMAIGRHAQWQLIVK